MGTIRLIICSKSQLDFSVYLKSFTAYFFQNVSLLAIIIIYFLWGGKKGKI
jgi:hypothetical protein